MIQRERGSERERETETDRDDKDYNLLLLKDKDLSTKRSLMTHKHSLSEHRKRGEKAIIRPTVKI